MNMKAMETYIRFITITILILPLKTTVIPIVKQEGQGIVRFAKPIKSKIVLCSDLDFNRV